MTDGDDDLRTRFDLLRDADEADPPPFTASSSHGESLAAATGSRAHGIFWLLLAAVILAIGVGLRHPSRQIRPPIDPLSGLVTGSDLTQWTSPTASLLRTPGSDLLTPPSLLSSVLDHATSPLVRPKGAGR